MNIPGLNKIQRDLDEAKGRISVSAEEQRNIANKEKGKRDELNSLWRKALDARERNIGKYRVSRSLEWNAKRADLMDKIYELDVSISNSIDPKEKLELETTKSDQKILLADMNVRVADRAYATELYIEHNLWVFLPQSLAVEINQKKRNWRVLLGRTMI